MSKRVNRSCQQIDRLETLRIECRSLGKTESEMVKCARQAVKSERSQTRSKLVKTLDSDWLTVKLN